MIEIYTDGAFRKTGLGGWSFVIKTPVGQKIRYGYQYNTTSQRMELTAIVEALEYIGTLTVPVTLYSDSQYAVKGINEWMLVWSKNGWRKHNRKQIENLDLWKTIHSLTRASNVEFKWVRGHDGNEGNELADKMANKAITKAQEIEYESSNS